MSEDRMLSDEILLGLINKNSGGGGGGTDDYNDLKNQPQIGGVTLQGNKSLEDLGVKNEFIGTTAQWNALTEEQRKTYDTYQFTDDFTEGRYIYLPTIYSEEERQVGVWKDGKPLYQKVWTVTLPSSHDTSGGFVIDSDVSYIEEIAISGGYIKEAGGAISALNGGIPDLAGWGYGIHINPSHELCLLSGGNTTYIGGGTAVVILQYTKTTDTAGSGIWTPSGEIAHHYSADEQIVGTWADGSTVWEKTQIGGIIISANDTWYDTNITGVSRVVSFGCSLIRDNEQIGNSFNGGGIDYIVRDGVLKIKGHGFSQAENYSLGHLTVQYTKTA